MRAMSALVKREFLEHRGAFLYAPCILLALVGAAALYALLTGNLQFTLVRGPVTAASAIFQASLGVAFLLWSAYLLIGLLFYYADSFSADRRNNALLFWKSMPQSDLKILTSKALSGITVFLALIFGFAMLTGLLIYAVLLLASVQNPNIVIPGPVDAIVSYIQMGIVGVAYLVLTLLWYAPGLAWVAALSTLFQRWTIPLAFLIPVTVVFLEHLLGISRSHPITEFLLWRFGSFLHGSDASSILLGQTDRQALDLIWTFVSNIDWPHMAAGLIFTGAMVYLASEYRRRRIYA